jgi:protein TonB
LTGNTFVTGTGTRFAGGITARAGTSKKAVRDKRARPDGVGRVKQSVPVAPAAKIDRSRPPSLIGTTSWDTCRFPAEADIDQINTGSAVITVLVGADGRAKSATTISDTGYGFGEAARRCALQRRYQPALDEAGRAIAQTLPPLRVRFRR